MPKSSHIQSLPQNVLREIARRVDMRNRTALEATSRTMRQAARPVIVETTQATQAALCRAVARAFELRRVLVQFTDAQLRNKSFAPAIEKAVQARVAKLKDPNLSISMVNLCDNIAMLGGGYGRRYMLHNLFVGRVNGMRIGVDAEVERDRMRLIARPDRTAETRNGWVSGWSPIGLRAMVDVDARGVMQLRHRTMNIETAAVLIRAGKPRVELLPTTRRKRCMSMRLDARSRHAPKLSTPPCRGDPFYLIPNNSRHYTHVFSGVHFISRLEHLPVHEHKIYP
jgi:hypothetical protein